jgi:AraC-like DNA-binding protein
MKHLYIKHMVCRHCLKSVKKILESLGIEIETLQLGEVQVRQALGNVQIEQLRQALWEEGFELIDDKKTQLIEQIKAIVIEEVHQSTESPSRKPLHQNFSDYLQERLGVEYNYLSHLFSSVEGRSIEKYLIAQKVERIKELLFYNELTLSEIAWQMNYSSVQHLSSQFKKVTGLSPSEFKKQKNKKRKPLNSV